MLPNHPKLIKWQQQKKKNTKNTKNSLWKMLPKAIREQLGGKQLRLKLKLKTLWQNWVSRTFLNN